MSQKIYINIKEDWGKKKATKVVYYILLYCIKL